MTDIPINDVNRRVQFTSNTGTGPFAFTFEVLDQTDIEVYKNRILLTLTTDYTVTINANGTGSITLVSALVATDVLTIIGSRAYSRTTDFTAGGDLRAAALNEQLDSNIIMAQQLEEILSRTVRVHPGDTNLNLTIPSSADRANGFLSFDSNGDVAINSVVDLSFLTLERLDIDNVRIDGNTLSSTTGSLILAPTADVEINIPASSSLYMQRAGTTALDFAFTSVSQEVRFINTTTATTYSVIQSNHLGGTSSDLILKSDGGPLELDTGGGTIPLKDDGVQRGYLNINTANTIKLYTGTGTGTLNTTFDGADVTIAGELVVSGNLTVDGTTTTINSTTLTVDDKNIVLASGAASSLAADGAGITIDGASASLTYVHLTGAMTFNKDVDIGDNDIENAQKLHFTENVSLYPSDGDDSILNLQAEDTGSAQLRFITGTGSGVFRGGIVASQNNVFGLKDSNDQTFIKSQEGNLPTQIFHTYDSPSAGSYVRIEAGSNFVKLYGSEGVEAQKYKDADDTSYYLEPAGTSVLATVGATQLNVDNITIDGNTISSTDTDGNINLRCNGNGVVDVDSELFVYGNAINGTSAYVQIGNTDTGGDDVRIQGPNPNFSLYDSTAVADGVAAYTGGVNFYGQKTNTAYHKYSAIRPRIINGLDSDTAKTGALHFGVSDGASSASTNIIFKIEPDGIEVAGNITSTNDPLKISATTASSTANIILEGDTSPILSLRASGSNDDKITFKSDGAFQYIDTNDQLTIQTGTNDALFLFGSSDIRTDAINGTHTISSRAGDISFITGTSGSTTERMRIAGAGGISVSADMSFGDNDKAIFGAGSDLQIYHDAGGDSYITESNASGQLRIQAGNIKIADADGNNFIYMTDLGTGGLVNLYHNGSEKLATSSTGVDVTGNYVNSGHLLHNNNSGLKIIGGGDATNAGSNLTLYGGSNASAGTFRFRNGTATHLEVAGNGDISFYDSLGSSQSFFWDASAESLGIGTSSVTSGFKLDVIGDARFSDVAGDDGVELGWSAGGSAGFVQAYDRGASAFRDLSLNNAVTIDSSGNVGIGTDLPSYLIHADAATATDPSYIAASSGSDFIVAIGSQNSPGVGQEAFIGTLSNDALKIKTNNTERMRIDSSGNVGIGAVPVGYAAVLSALQIGGNANIAAESATGASQFLHISQNANFDGDNSWEYISTDEATSYYQNSGTHVWRYAASGTAGNDISWSEAMRIDSSGNLLVGTTTFNSNNVGVLAGASGAFFATRDGNTPAQFNRKTSDGDIVGFQKDGSTVGRIGATAGPVSYLVLNDTISDNVGAIKGGSRSILPSSSTGGTQSGTMDLGGSSDKFRDLYLSGAMFGGGVTSSSDTTSHSSGNAFSGTSSYANWTSWGTGTHTHASFRNGTSQVGYIQTNTTSTTYSTSSDYRLKENVVDLTGATDRIKQIPVHRFNFIADPDTTVDGFLAHEVQNIVPEAVTGAKDAMRDEEYEVTPAVLDDDGNVVTEAVMGTRSVPDYQGIDQSKLVPLLVATIKELEARITALENA